ncbi:TPA: hypothetical protein HA338_06750 [Methanosarcina acetivorans]|uniref:Uncharacterized protein n=1 Tax=Methanosarcina acetivorans TaxID=2214 RepID=A0A832W6Z9_9EURY|nr:hypothetical protein [Methanosarcina acetivorans]HIH93739.1 hypothetical protein [Methanosarcina acetivorans]
MQKKIIAEANTPIVKYNKFFIFLGRFSVLKLSIMNSRRDGPAGYILTLKGS